MITSWATYSGDRISDIAVWVRDNCVGKEVHIGTDSMQHSKKTQFVTVVVIITPGKGGRVALQRETVWKLASLRERLLKETWRSVTLGLQITTVVPQGALTVHVDANPDPKHRSSLHVQELVGMVVGQGFACKIKPESWAASHAADHIVRTQGKMPRVA